MFNSAAAWNCCKHAAAVAAAPGPAASDGVARRLDIDYIACYLVKSAVVLRVPVGWF